MPAKKQTRKQYGRRATGKTQTTISLSDEMLAKAKRNAEEDGRSISNYIEQLPRLRRPQAMKTPKTKTAEPLAPAHGSALAMTFRIEGGGKTVEGTMRVPDDDGTTHLLMMMHGLLKQVAESVPELCKAGEITVSAKWKAQNDSSAPTEGAKIP